MKSTETSEENILKSAVDMTCAALVEVYKVDEAKLSLLSDIIARALLEKFQGGERNASLLARHATRMASKSLGIKHN
jgi:hypothetical protein